MQVLRGKCEKRTEANSQMDDCAEGRKSCEKLSYNEITWGSWGGRKPITFGPSVKLIVEKCETGCKKQHVANTNEVTKAI